MEIVPLSMPSKLLNFPIAITQKSDAFRATRYIYLSIHVTPNSPSM